MNRTMASLGAAVFGGMVVLTSGCHWILSSDRLPKPKDAPPFAETSSADSGAVSFSSPATWSLGKPLIASANPPERPLISRHEVSFGRSTAPVRLASHQDFDQPLQITGLAESPVSNWADILRHAQCLPAHQRVQVDFRDPAGSTAVDRSEYVSATEVWQMIGRHLERGQVIRWQHAGVDQLTFCQQGVVTSVWMRQLNPVGLFQVCIEMWNLGDEAIEVPRECVAMVGEESLACLSVAETLELIYGDAQAEPKETGRRTSQRMRFSCVSASEAYLNWNAISSPDPSSNRAPVFIPQHLTYPGLAHRGDAIALTGSLLKCDWIEPQTKQSGWILFGPASTKAAAPLKLFLTIVNEPIELEFAFDASLR